MRYVATGLIGLALLLGLLALAAQFSSGSPAGVSVDALTDSDGDGLPDPADPTNPQPGEDFCPFTAEDFDGVDDDDGCPDTDSSIASAMDEAFSMGLSTVETRTVEIWVDNGNYPADLLVHALAVSTVGACEVEMVPEPGDGFYPHTVDADGDTALDTKFSLLEWTVSLGAGESLHTSRDYEIVCLSAGEHSFEMQVDVVPWPPVQEEDVSDNVQKTFPVVSVTASTSSVDSDGDGFSDEMEQFLGTDPYAACPSDDSHDAWPLDFNNDARVGILDMAHLTPPAFGSTASDFEYAPRMDLNGDGKVNMLDMAKLSPPVFGQTCSP